MRELRTEILIVGGGLGGVAGALAALRLGRNVVLTEETDWLGGQLTSQAVPPDEHPWIEQRGCTATYRSLRERIRDFYRRNYPLTPTAYADPHLNPGFGSVSRLCHEPRAALAAIEEMLAPYRTTGQLTVLLRHQPVAADTELDRISAVTLRDDAGDQVVVSAPYVLDATELGDLLPLAGAEHVVGAESHRDTGELHALEIADPLDHQAITWCFALDHFPGEDHSIDKPQDYDFWRSYQASFWPGPQLGWEDPHPKTLERRHRPIFDGETDRERSSDFWHFRRILYRKNLIEDFAPSDITLVNWPQVDYWLGPIVNVPDEQRNQHLRGARQLSLSLLYWMQNEAPRYDGGVGYPGLRLRNDIVDTYDGLAKHVYVRESRRIQAEFTVLEHHVGVDARGENTGSEIFQDSVGIGCYRIDLHPSTAPRTYVDISSYPFQIPLAALIPIRVDNLLPANKNIGTTHITNGCYRLHPVEWNIGEAAGALAAYCLTQSVTPRQVSGSAQPRQDFQHLLSDTLDIELAWPDEIRTTPR